MARKLREIKVKEISLVDAPANRVPFLFFKREAERGGKRAGKFLSNEKNNEVNTMLFDEIMNILNIEKNAVEKDTALKNAREALAEWNDDLPEEVGTGFKSIAGVFQKRAEAALKQGVDAEAEKAGKKFSKNTVKFLQDIMRRIANVLPEEARVLKSDDEPADEDAKKLYKGMKVLVERLDSIEKTVSEKKSEDSEEEKDKDGDKKPDIAKMVESLIKRIETVEKAKGVKKGVDTDGDGDDPEVDLWESIPL